ncbi:MAG: hypothetical protein ABMA64_37775 [Myxococcota bacterium]
MTDDESLIEQVVSAYRERSGRGEIRSAPAWHDLDEAGRVAAFDRTVAARRLEAAVDPDGLSSTARAVLARLR